MALLKLSVENKPVIDEYIKNHAHAETVFVH